MIIRSICILKSKSDNERFMSKASMPLTHQEKNDITAE